MKCFPFNFPLYKVLKEEHCLLYCLPGLQPLKACITLNKNRVKPGYNIKIEHDQSTGADAASAVFPSLFLGLARHVIIFVLHFSSIFLFGT